MPAASIIEVPFIVILCSTFSSRCHQKKVICVLEPPVFILFPLTKFHSVLSDSINVNSGEDVFVSQLSLATSLLKGLFPVCSLPKPK